MAHAGDKASKTARLEHLIGYDFRDKERAWQSLHAAGSPFARTSDGNKRLAMMGDVALRFLIVNDMSEAEYTRGTRLPLCT